MSCNRRETSYTHLNKYLLNQKKVIMIRKLETIANDLLTIVQGGEVWDEEAKFNNMIQILFEKARTTKTVQEKKLIISLLLIFKTMEYYDFDPYESHLEYILPGVEKFSFEFQGFSFDAVLNFITGIIEEDFEQRSYKFIYMDDMQENLGTLVAKFNRKREWKEIKDSLYTKQSAILSLWPKQKAGFIKSAFLIMWVLNLFFCIINISFLY